MSEAEITGDLAHLKRASSLDAEDSTGKKSKIAVSLMEASESGEILDRHPSGKSATSMVENGKQVNNGDNMVSQSREDSHVVDASPDPERLHQLKDELSRIEADAAEDKGSRHSMEDAWVILPDASLEFPGTLRCAHFAIYDGHGGRLAAEYAQKHLHKNVLAAGLPHGWKSC